MHLLLLEGSPLGPGLALTISDLAVTGAISLHYPLA